MPTLPPTDVEYTARRPIVVKTDLEEKITDITDSLLPVFTPPSGWYGYMAKMEADLPPLPGWADAAMLVTAFEFYNNQVTGLDLGGLWHLYLDGERHEWLSGVTYETSTCRTHGNSEPPLAGSNSYENTPGAQAQHLYHPVVPNPDDLGGTLPGVDWTLQLKARSIDTSGDFSHAYVFDRDQWPTHAKLYYAVNEEDEDTDDSAWAAGPTQEGGFGAPHDPITNNVMFSYSDPTIHDSGFPIVFCDAAVNTWRVHEFWVIPIRYVDLRPGFLTGDLGSPGLVRREVERTFGQGARPDALRGAAEG